jgi:predicted dehydrogenase
VSTASRLLILGTGSIAQRHAVHFGAIAECRLAAAVDTVPGRAAAFAQKNGIAHHFDTLDAALAWGDFDAAINSTPDPVHLPTTLALLAAGKPVFCEKPLAVNHTDALAMTEAAERAGLINMVNLTYRNAHALQRARTMVLAGAIGEVRHVEASYLQSWLTARHWGDWHTDERWLWRLSSAHGSMGVLGDVGIHIVDFATFGTGLDIAALSARLKVFDKAPGNAIGPYRLDANDSAVLTVEFSNGALGVIHMSRFATGRSNDLHLVIHGTEGALRIWADANASTLDACLGADIQTQTWQRLDCKQTPANAARFIAALRSGVNGEPDFRRAAEVQKVLDLCFVSDSEGRRVAV